MQQQSQQGLLNTYHISWKSRGMLGWLIAALLLAFYCDLYFDLSGKQDSIAEQLGLKDRWYLYGFLYGSVMSIGGFFYLRKHGNSRYHQIRVAVNLLIQWLLGFSVPFLMMLLSGKDYYFSYLWPLKIEYFYPSNILNFPILIVVYSFVASLIAVPILTLRYGKRWYCSWVCGCGALANTFGDPWRHLSNKSSKAWKIEKATVYSVLVIALVTTTLVAIRWFMNPEGNFYHAGFDESVSSLQKYYGLVIGAILAGVIGVGFYPVLGTRVWCRFFCPMAALLGLIQKLGRFRIRVKKDMCISCGNCSTYCEMGIDVRSYAIKNETFTRASCVGCGMCAHVCPRGVLKLDSSPKPNKKLKIIS